MSRGGPQHLVWWGMASGYPSHFRRFEWELSNATRHRQESCAEFTARFRIEMRLLNTHIARYAGCWGFGLAFPAIGALPQYRLPAPAQVESEDRI
jgi:hypothetical protein